MKTSHYHHAKLAAAIYPLLLLASCTDDLPGTTGSDGSERVAFEFSATIDQDNSSRADESGFADGDRMGVFVVNYRDNAPGTLSLSDNQANNIAVTFNAEDNKWTPVTDIYWLDGETRADIYGYYPFNNALSDVNEYSFEVSSDQSIPGDDSEMGAYEASDFLWAKDPGVVPGTKVSLTYRHALAGVKVVLQPGEGYSAEEWDKLSRIVTVDNTLRSAEIDMSTGSASPVGNFDRNIVMNPEPECYRAVVIPQTVAAGKSVIGITIDGVTCNYNRDGGGMTYAPGKLHQFTIKVNRSDNQGHFTLELVSEDITPWEVDNSSHDFEANSYLVVDVPEEGTLKACLAAAGADYTTVKNLKITGKLTDEDFRFMREEMSALTSVNLKEAKMVHVEYQVQTEGLNPWEWPTDYMDNAIPIWAFSNNTTIRRIVLPDNIVRISSYAFWNLRLTSTLIIPESVKAIDTFALSGISEEANIIMPSSLEFIGRCAFFGTVANFELKLNNNIKYIGEGAFSGARGATGTFNVPTKLEYLGEDAFSGCGHDLVGDIIIPLGFTEIPKGAFRGIGFKNGTNLTIPEGVTKINDSAFEGLVINNSFSLPKDLKYIGQSVFKYCKFRGLIQLPSKIWFLGPGAFANTNYSGDLVYPESIDYVCGGGGEFVGMGDDFGGAFRGSKISSLTISSTVLQIGGAAFEDCTELKNLTIGKNVNFIGARAFNNCPQIQTVICHAKEPPTIEENTFAGMFFDKCILEVPEESVNAYRNSSWNIFQNITPHHELAFNIPDISCLDKGITRTGIIRAESSWKVTECPDWVHVTPDHADYKEELTITVDPIASGADSREGRIVFSLDGKDYTTYTTVRQFAYSEAAEDTEIILQEASVGAPHEIPVFIVGEGFNADNIVSGEYLKRMRETMEHLFAIEPYKTYRNYFTVTTAVACSPDEGTGDVYNVKVNKFDSNGPMPDEYKLKEYARSVSRHIADNTSNALIIMVSNYNSFQGWSTIDWDGCSIAGIGIIDDVYPYDYRGLVQHFAGGEAFAGLGNEMVTHFEHIKGCTCPFCSALGSYNNMKSRGFFENLTMSSKITDAPWSDFIFHPKYSSMVDMWEGGYNHFRGVWRSEAQSVMNNYIAYYNTISRYAIYKHIMRRAGLSASLDDFIANDKIEIPQ